MRPIPPPPTLTQPCNTLTVWDDVVSDVVPCRDGPLALWQAARPGGGEALDNTTRLGLRSAGTEPNCWAGKGGRVGGLRESKGASGSMSEEKILILHVKDRIFGRPRMNGLQNYALDS